MSETAVVEKKSSRVAEVKVKNWQEYLKQEKWAGEIRGLPLMDDGALANLALDIAEKGQRHPIELVGGSINSDTGFYEDGEVADGRDTLRAYELPTLAGRAPWFVAVSGLTALDVAISEAERKDVRRELYEILYQKLADEGKKRRLGNLKKRWAKPASKGPKTSTSADSSETSAGEESKESEATTNAKKAGHAAEQRRYKASGTAKPTKRPKPDSTKPARTLAQAITDALNAIARVNRINPAVFNQTTLPKNVRDRLGNDAPLMVFSLLHRLALAGVNIPEFVKVKSPQWVIDEEERRGSDD